MVNENDSYQFVGDELGDELERHETAGVGAASLGSSASMSAPGTGPGREGHEPEADATPRSLHRHNAGGAGFRSKTSDQDKRPGSACLRPGWCHPRYVDSSRDRGGG